MTKTNTDCFSARAWKSVGGEPAFISEAGAGKNHDIIGKV